MHANMESNWVKPSFGMYVFVVSGQTWRTHWWLLPCRWYLRQLRTKALVDRQNLPSNLKVRSLLNERFFMYCQAARSVRRNSAVGQAHTRFAPGRYTVLAHTDRHHPTWAVHISKGEYVAKRDFVAGVGAVASWISKIPLMKRDFYATLIMNPFVLKSRGASTSNGRLRRTCYMRDNRQSFGKEPRIGTHIVYSFGERCENLHQPRCLVLKDDLQSLVVEFLLTCLGGW